MEVKQPEFVVKRYRRNIKEGSVLKVKADVQIFFMPILFCVIGCQRELSTFVSKSPKIYYVCTDVGSFCREWQFQQGWDYQSHCELGNNQD